MFRRGFKTEALALRAEKHVVCDVLAVHAAGASVPVRSDEAEHAIDVLRHIVANRNGLST